MKKLTLGFLLIATLGLGISIGWYLRPRRADATLVPVTNLPPESITYLSALAEFAKGWTQADAEAFLKDIRVQAKKAQDASALRTIYDGVACFSIQQLEKEGRPTEMDARMADSIAAMIADYSAGKFAGMPEEKLAQTVSLKIQQQKTSQ